MDYFIPSNAHQVFWDLNNSYEDCTVPLRICEEEVLGKGGYGFVCKGQLVPEVSIYIVETCIVRTCMGLNIQDTCTYCHECS